MNKDKVNIEVEKTIQLLNESEIFENDQYLFQKIELRLNKQENSGFKLFISDNLKPVFIAVLIIINFLSILILKNYYTTKYNISKTELNKEVASFYYLSRDNYTQLLKTN